MAKMYWLNKVKLYHLKVNEVLHNREEVLFEGKIDGWRGVIDRKTEGKNS